MTGPAGRPEELAAATMADRRAQLEDGLADLDCGHCGGVVRVKKNSLAHTSIQWTADAVRRCPAYAIRDGCPHLRRSVDSAVADGWLEVPEDPLEIPRGRLVHPSG
ncbi:MAG: hypothetical protein QOI50_1816 [Pseudonocardiales bacterium]|nr:hypothetical protein [Pseudonocardiales bacterium]MDT7629886.1 hypothetical protein [Pseudonocardiales bacterium]MDT7672623.1 hypothetical protein [Pseudonocardiales bacterium]MDT7686755.1 hypothetical protein [Pseudonocardiales bacterium]